MGRETTDDERESLSVLSRKSMIGPLPAGPQIVVHSAIKAVAAIPEWTTTVALCPITD